MWDFVQAETCSIRCAVWQGFQKPIYCPIYLLPLSSNSKKSKFCDPNEKWKIKKTGLTYRCEINFIKSAGNLPILENIFYSDSTKTFGLRPHNAQKISRVYHKYTTNEYVKRLNDMWNLNGFVLFPSLPHQNIKLWRLIINGLKVERLHIIFKFWIELLYLVQPDYRYPYNFQ